MDLISPKAIKEILLKHNIKPNKILGQNFLIDGNILKKIIDAADLKPSDTILEVGPGIGTLTQGLAENAGKIIAVEKDKKMIEVLYETLKDYKNLKIENWDILKFIENCKLKIENYKVVANIPYYISAPLIRLLLENENKPELVVLLLQKEVAQRICAKPPDMSLLAVSAQFYADVKIISYVSKNCFLPAPKVDSAIIKIVPRIYTVIARRPQATRQSRVSEQKLFFKIVKAGFLHPRKQLAGNLSKALKIDKKTADDWLKKNNISPAQRAETLSIDDWKNLSSTCE